MSWNWMDGAMLLMDLVPQKELIGGKETVVLLAEFVSDLHCMACIIGVWEDCVCGNMDTWSLHFGQDGELETERIPEFNMYDYDDGILLLYYFIATEIIYSTAWTSGPDSKSSKLRDMTRRPPDLKLGGQIVLPSSGLSEQLCLLRSSTKLRL